MVRSWTTTSIPSDPAAMLRHVALAHEAAIDSRFNESPLLGVRAVVQESWQRSLQLRLNPDILFAAIDLAEDDLRDYRAAHPLSLVLPTIHQLLIRHTFDTGLIVAVGDQAGRLLWIDGDRALRRKAEEMLFVEGADWSEAAVGTSAPGTALALDHGIQVRGAEHFSRIVHPWSCTAVPVHDPDSGLVLGVIDITGGDDAAAPATLPLIEAAVAAVEAELRIRRLDDRSQAGRPSAAGMLAHRETAAAQAPSGSVRTPPASPPAIVPRAEDGWLLSVLGRDSGQLESGSGSAAVSRRHAEILTLLSWHRDGLSATRLSELLYGRHDATVTLRAEIVRLRRILQRVDSGLGIDAQPYRLQHPLELDAHRVLAFLDRGAHRVALAAYTGALLPGSSSPGIRAIGDDVRLRLRDALLTAGSADTLLEYARTDDAAYDTEVWRAALHLLPARSPKRAAVVARIERIDEETRRRN